MGDVEARKRHHRRVADQSQTGRNPLLAEAHHQPPGDEARRILGKDTPLDAESCVIDRVSMPTIATGEAEGNDA